MRSISRRLARQVLRLNNADFIQLAYLVGFRVRFGVGVTPSNAIGQPKLLKLWQLAKEQHTFTLEELHLMKEMNK